MNCYAERLIGTLRRELFDHVIVTSERHARRLLREFQVWCNEDRLISPSRKTLLIAGRLSHPRWARSSRSLASAVFTTGTPAAQPELPGHVCGRTMAALRCSRPKS
jgi:uroporphyrinogen-III synthase